MAESNQIWDEALELIRRDLNTPTFKTWFEHAAPLGMVDDTFVIGVQNDFARDWLESRYSGLIRSALSSAAGSPVSVSFTVAPDDASRAPEATPEEPAAVPDPAPPDARAEPDPLPFVVGDVADAESGRVAPKGADGDFNPKYTFESFVIGSSNRFAHAAALAVAEAPGAAYNPLFIYGGVGLGKTHLLQAIGHYAQMHVPHMRVRYVSTEQFTNDFINSLSDKGKRRIDGFRRHYRTNDVLLVDDVQFLKGKEGIQEEFFHTFNSLQQAGKQIVMSSDRPPKDIATLEERLRSRFEMGLITDIQPPDVETRIAILRRKVESEGLDVPDDVMSFIADRVSSNIRELEGALIRVIAFSSLTRHAIDLDLAQSVLKDIFPERRAQPISVPSIQKEVCRFYGVHKADLTGNKRSQAIVFPRQMAMHLSRELTDLSLPRIGAEFGGRDHTTVMHATNKIQRLMNSDHDVYNQVQDLTNRIRQHA
jgi:chromosomal replication initiator protein